MLIYSNAFGKRRWRLRLGQIKPTEMIEICSRHGLTLFVRWGAPALKDSWEKNFIILIFKELLLELFKVCGSNHFLC
jgi:hypothetical protein